MKDNFLRAVPLRDFLFGTKWSPTFADASFDVVLSTVGVMFTPNPERAAAAVHMGLNRQPGQVSGRTRHSSAPSMCQQAAQVLQM